MGSPSTEAPAPRERLEEVPAQSGTSRVLIVDDEDETRDMLQLLLERAGYQVLTACNGREAHDVLRTNRVDLILLDLQMPIMDGYEFRHEQRRDPRLLRIATVVLTGTDYEPMLDPAIAETLRKPVRAEALLSIVRRCCKQT
jgi:CheY-like chemotaxis protein